jgi:hypothetical protein
MRMKTQVVLITLIGITGVSAAEKKMDDAFLSFRATAAPRPFGIAEAEALANAKFMAVYGVCGMVLFKEKKGPIWIFATKVGYAGTPGRDIAIVEPPPTVPSFATSETKPNQSPEPTAGLRPAAAHL